MAISPDIWDKLKELFDAIRLEHSGSIYDTGDYQKVVEGAISKLKIHYKPIEEKADALDKILKMLTSSEESDVIFPLDKFMVMKEQAENWKNLKTTIIQKSEDGKTWRNLNVMTMIEVEKKLETVKTAILTARNKLYESLPAGDVDSFALLNVIKVHVTDLDEILKKKETESSEKEGQIEWNPKRSVMKPL